MDSFAEGRKHISTERLITLSVVTTLTILSIVLMLACCSPEFTWDEADYVASTTKSWGFLWGVYNHNDGHGHGPLAIELAKLGQEVLPLWVGSLECRLRFFEALAGSLAVGFLYWALRLHFRTSRAAALVGASLLLFSVIRLEETNVIGPHDLMLVSTLAIAAFGYQWRDKPTLHNAIGLGAVMAFGALSMEYVIPAAFCWALAVTPAGKWFAWSRTHFKVSWLVLVMIATAAIIVVVLWPPGVLQMAIVRDLRRYLHNPFHPAVPGDRQYRFHPVLVGDRIFEVAPRWAAFYWLGSLDAPIIVISSSVILIALLTAYKRGRLCFKHAYLAIFLAFSLASALAALAGSRNLLQFIGVLCLATGALFDEALRHERRLIRLASAAVIILAMLNLIWLSRSSSYTPVLATNGYRAFLRQDADRLREKAKALVFGRPILRLYAQQYGTSIAWDVTEMALNTRADAPLPSDVKYVLIPAFIYQYMPAEQPMRRIVAKQWKAVWSYKVDHSWELRLYENPQAITP
jgi:hypothetical protein